MLSESQSGNVLADYDLGKLYDTEKLGTKDEEKSQKYYFRALKGFLEIEPAAEKLKPYLQYRIGKMHCYGLGTKQDYTQAFAWFLKSSEQGNRFAQFSLANLYYYGSGVEKNLSQAFLWYMKSAAQGQPYAAYSVAQMYANGEVVNKDEVQAQSYYKQSLADFQKLEADKQVDDNMFYKMGRMFRLGLGIEIDIQKAIDYFKRAANLGNKNAKRTMALEYISGENVEQDIDKGIEMLTELADSGDIMSAYKLGKIYLSGEIVYTDLDKAEKYLKQAADDDNEYAMYAIAKLYISDKKKDITKAVDLLKKACVHDTIKPYAAYTYAKILLDDNVYHDTAKAVQLLEETANNNNWCAYLLGKLYLFGSNDIENDKEKAIEWLTKSAEAGNEYAETLLQQAEDYEHAMITNTLLSLFAHLARIIEYDYMCSHRKLKSKVDKKLRQMINRKKEEIGIKSDGAINFDY